MFIWQQKTRIALAARKATSVLALLCLCGSFAHAEKMNSTIQEAIYEFEMKGETAKAIRLLEKVTTQGDREDRENAFFYLGKIKELAGNDASANFYYQQSLANTKETSKAYWLSEREAFTGNTYESLIKNKVPLRSSIEKVFKGEPSYILLRNGGIKKVLADTIVDMRVGLPEKSDVLSIDGSGLWFQASTRDSLFFKPHYSKQPTKAYPIAATTEFFARGDNAIAQSGHTLTILDKKGIVAQVNETYNGCHIEGYYSTTNHYILNCTDNALHFVSSVDGTETYTISQFDAIQKVLIDGNDILLLSGNYLFCYQPRVRSSPLENRVQQRRRNPPVQQAHRRTRGLWQNHAHRQEPRLRREHRPERRGHHAPARARHARAILERGRPHHGRHAAVPALAFQLRKAHHGAAHTHR